MNEEEERKDDECSLLCLALLIQSVPEEDKEILDDEDKEYIDSIAVTPEEKKKLIEATEIEIGTLRWILKTLPCLPKEDFLKLVVDEIRYKRAVVRYLENKMGGS